MLRWGTGAINIGACRVAPASERDIEQQRRVAGFNVSYRNGEPSVSLSGGADGSLHRRDRAEFDPSQGRWPSNLLHDGSPEVLAMFPDALGQQADLSVTAPSPNTRGIYGKMNRKGEASAAKRYANAGGTDFAALPGQRRADSGSAARFFNCCPFDEHDAEIARLFYTPKADAEDRAGSRHPTVKPLSLLQHLVRLITPPGGTVLDCFAGTGSTGEAAWREGFRSVLVERDGVYLRDIARRMELASTGPQGRKDARAKRKAIKGDGALPPLLAAAGAVA